MPMENAGVNERLFKYISDTIAITPFYQLLTIHLQKLAPGYAEVWVTPVREHTNPLGLIHGGLIMALADAAMGNAIRTLGINGVTVDCSTSFLSAASPGRALTAQGSVIKAGNKMIFTRAQVVDQEKVIAEVKGTFFNTGIIEL